MFAEHGFTIYVRQVRADNVRETLKALDKKGVRNFLAHLDIDFTLRLLRAVNTKHLNCDVTNFRLNIRTPTHFLSGVVSWDGRLPASLYSDQLGTSVCASVVSNLDHSVTF